MLNDHIFYLLLMAASFLGGAAISVGFICIISGIMHKRGRMHIPKSDN